MSCSRQIETRKKIEPPDAVKSGTSNKYYKMTTKISLEKFADQLSDHTKKDLIEMLYDKMSDDDLIEMAAESQRECVGCGERKSNGIEEDGEWICEDCDGPDCDCCGESLLNQGCGKMVNRGCCSNGDCARGVEALCGECGTWDEEDEVWRCPDCQDYHENQKHDKQPPACQTCKKPCWSDDDEVQFVIHGCAVCKECFDEHEEEHALEKKINLTVGA